MVRKLNNSFTLILVGIIETIAIGWLFKTEKVVKEINRNAKGFKMPKIWFYAAVKFIAPVALTVIFVWNIVNLFVNNDGLYGGADGYNMLSNVLAGWVIFGLCLISGFVINRIKTKNQPKEGKTWDGIEE